MKIIMTAFLFVKSHKKGVLVKEGKAAAMTCGMVSPTMIQKATMPPNALNKACQQLHSGNRSIGLQSPLSDLNLEINHIVSQPVKPPTDIAMSPDLPKQYSMVAWKEFTPHSFELITIN